MIETIYVEQDAWAEPLTGQILKRYHKARVIECEHYGEIFNRKAQNFRLQKRQASLILARKHGKLLLPTPAQYGIGSETNFYFSHMLNCIYDCRYCFLQGMYRSAHYVLFVNYDDFLKQIRKVCEAHTPQPVHIFSGYDCDSLALEPATQFVQSFLPVFQDYPHALLELRTKSTQVRALLNRQPIDNIVIAFSFTPQAISAAIENKVPPVQHRLDAIEKLQQAGWKIGIRLDPLIDSDKFEPMYSELLRQIFTVVKPAQLHSVSLGSFRLPASFFKSLQNLYPDEKLFAASMQTNAGMTGYDRERESLMLTYVKQDLLQYIGPDKLFVCQSA